MHEGEAALSHHFAHIPVAELVGDVPADGLDDEQAIKVAAFEERWLVRRELGHAADYRHSLRFAPEPSEKVTMKGMLSGGRVE